jgi:hypothetical protein
MLHAADVAVVKPHQPHAQNVAAAVIILLPSLLFSLGEIDAGSAVALHILKPRQSACVPRCSIFLLLLC